MLNHECEKFDKKIDVLLEVNSGEEAGKSGVPPENVESLARQIQFLPNIRVLGLMTMGPWVDDPEELRPYFRRTREIFDYVRTLKMQNINMVHLSMGMSDSYRIAIEEGATIVRLGTILFGQR